MSDSKVRLLLWEKSCGTFDLCLHLRCHAARFAMILHLGCTYVCMLCPLQFSEGDVEESAFALAPACCGVRGQTLLVAVDLVSACIAWNCIATSCVALNVLQLHLLALQLQNDCRSLAKQSLRNRNCSRSVGGALGMVIGLSGLFGFGAKPSRLPSVAGCSLD